MMDCLSLLNIELSGLEHSKHMNSRLKSEWFEKIRFFNQLDFKLHPSRYFRLAGKELYQDKGEQSYGFMSESERKEMLDIFRISNKTLFQRYFSSEDVFDLAKPPKLLINQDEILELHKKDVHFLKRQFGI